MSEPQRAERGCLILAALFGVGVLAGVVLLVLNDKGPLACLLGLIGGLALVLSKPWKPVTPEERRALAPAVDSGAEMARTLEALGIPLETGLTTPQDALVGGMAKAAISRGVQALNERRWDDAATGLGASILTLSREAGSRWTRVLAVAHRLRGAAHEGAGRRADALADYERALALSPDDEEARAGKARLGPA